ncbi:MAG: glucosaminidase domain-containing protein [Desulfobulbaceae bacterium]|nr:glucosaminidase domain-containing protein [Desulfobulbaceae bacterium]
MHNWLTDVKKCCGVTLFHWHQMLPNINSLSALAVILTIGFAFDTFAPRIDSPDLSASLVNNIGICSSNFLTRLKSQRDHTLAEEPTGTLSSSAFNQELLPPLQDSYSTDSEDSPKLGVTLSVRLPDTLASLHSEERKKLFIDLLLPTVLVALDEVKQERQQLLNIVAELGHHSPQLVFSASDLSWQQQIGADKTKFILGLTQKYRTEDVGKLLAKINVLPPSLIIAQSAIESGWGSSRFATEVNNLFGMYSTLNSSSENAVDGSIQPKIIAYESILDSVRSYILNINRLSAYRKLRQIRKQTLDPMLIAEGLARYSERKECYIADVKNIITYNNLRYFDTFILDAV